MLSAEDYMLSADRGLYAERRQRTVCLAQSENCMLSAEGGLYAERRQRTICLAQRTICLAQTEDYMLSAEDYMLSADRGLYAERRQRTSSLMYTTAFEINYNPRSRHAELNDIAEELLSLLEDRASSDKPIIGNVLVLPDNDEVSQLTKRQEERSTFGSKTDLKKVYTQFHKHLDTFLNDVSNFLKFNNFNIKWHKLSSVLKILSPEDIDDLGDDDLRKKWNKLTNDIILITKFVNEKSPIDKLTNISDSSSKLSEDMKNLNATFIIGTGEKGKPRAQSSGIGGVNHVGNRNERLEHLKNVFSLIKEMKALL
ncbi:hypothetical protein Btru_060540 [Bulinus truncatus]|nr:hypothetical protein Btru_060540 [Bulinus truncatus]